MATNRFKKSIETATDNTEDSIIENTTDCTIRSTVNNIKENIIESAVDNVLINTSNDILKKVLESGKKDKGSNHTIYLSADVGEVLVKYAKKAKKSKSTLVDEILREVLIKE